MDIINQGVLQKAYLGAEYVEAIHDLLSYLLVR